jgi:cysteine-rich repeat protein
MHGRSECESVPVHSHGRSSASDARWRPYRTGRAAAQLSIVITIALLGGCDSYNGGLIGNSRDSRDAGPKVPGMRDAAYDGAASDSSTDPAGDAATDPSTCNAGECWWSRNTSDSCKSAGLPGPSDRPESAQDGNVELSEIYLGFTKIRLGSTNPAGEVREDAWEDFGLDLDGVCTNSATCQGTSDVSCRSATRTLPFDGQLCRDNTLARLQPVVAAVPEIGERFGLSEQFFNCALWRGSYNTIVRIAGYNGRANDSRVRIDYYTSVGLQGGGLPWECTPQLTDFEAKYPRWRSSRAWLVDEAELTAPVSTPGSWPDSKLADADAYVRDGYLVARMPDDAPVGFVGNGKPHRGFRFKAQQAYWIGNLQKLQDGTWTVRDGLIAGRIKRDDLVQAFREVGFCESGQFASFYQSMLSYVDENADLLASGTNSGNLPCDAMSYAIGFAAAQVTPGTSAPAPKRFECCAPEQTDEQCSAVCGDGKRSGDEKCDTAIAAGMEGACPTECTAGDSCMPSTLQGSACMSECVATKISEIGPKDGCCPEGASTVTDRDCAPRCGNDVIESGETCDPASACVPCTSTNACLPVRSVGSEASCNLRCETMPITRCMNGDGCCPGGCTRSNDQDCSSSCGNKVIDAGETCEANTDKPCPASCNDDDACTSERQIGSAANCNLVCERTAITQPASGDDCCPPGASANNDGDCASMCGNKVVESGEQCDDGNQTAGDGCINCQMETPAQVCLARLGATDACAQCTCNRCTSQTLACQGTDNRNDAMLCDAMVDCARSTGCRNPDCLCGSSSLFTCLAGRTNGPCRNQVTAAAKTSSLLEIQSRADDTNYPLGRANAVGACVEANCKSECGL